MTEDYNGRIPSRLMRFMGPLAAAFTAMYGVVGVLHDDLQFSLSKSAGGAHLNAPLAWTCYAGMIMMSIAIIRLLAAEPGDWEFDWSESRWRGIDSQARPSG